MTRPQRPDRARAATRVRTAGLVALAAVVAVAGVLWWRRRAPAPPPAASRPVEAAVPDVTAGREPDLRKLVGRWLRPDGGYVIEVRAVGDDGRLDAAYFNPRPIHVEQATAWREGGMARIFLELKDVNYPGSTYRLSWDPATDRLSGIYFQAVERQPYDVYFVRMR